MKKKKIILNKQVWFTVITMLCFVVVSLFVIIACKEQKDTIKQKYDIFENHDISACEANDPLQNIEWLREYCKNIKEKKDILPVEVDLYKVIDKDEYIFQISVPSPIEYAPNEYYSTLYFRNCYGDTVFRWETATPPGGLYSDFMKDKEYITKLFYFVKQ